MTINFSNIEELIFLNAELRQKIDLRHIFDQWMLGFRIPALISMRNKAKLDLMAELTEDHVKIIEEFYKTSLTLERINYNIVENLNFPISDIKVNFENFAIYRNKNEARITAWR